MNTKETIKIEKEYTTSDLCLAIILKMNGGIIKKIVRLDQRRLVFYFKEREGLKKIINDYFSLSAQNHPYKKFYNEMREIKNMIYNYSLMNDAKP